MRYSFLLILLVIVLSGSTQTYNPLSIKPKARTLYSKALSRLMNDDFINAIPFLEKSIEADTNYLDAYLSLAGVHGELKEYNQAATYYETVQAKNANYFALYNLPYSINLAGLGKFDSALVAVNTFLSLSGLDETTTRSANYRKRCYEFAVDYKNKHPHSNYIFNPQNLGDSINSPQSEYLPTLSVDDSLLVFTRRRADGGEYFYRSSLLPSKLFSKASLIPGDLNQEAFKGAITVSADGEWLIFAGNIAGKTYGNFDLYICYATPSGWSEPENLGPNINSEFWESTPCLSPDKRALYFSSKREGGYGSADLYVSYRDVRGNWGKAINMGEAINSVGDEQAPFIHADNKTIYYTSNGLPGYGGTDLYVIRRGPNGDWSVPENLGYPINTIENEGSLAVAPNGTDAYYASDRSDSRGGLDIYQFELRKDIAPSKTVYIKGFVYDKITKKGLPCNVELIDNSTGKPLMLVQTDETGFYFITLPTESDFTFNVNRRGYLFYNKHYNLHDKAADSTYRENIYLQPLSLNATLILKNILFGNNDFVLKDISKVELDNMVQLLQENPSLHISINGYTDNIGSDVSNLLLSANRAKAVLEYFITKGIAAERLQSKGLGAAKPIGDNNNEAGKALNRRTEIVIIGM